MQPTSAPDTESPRRADARQVAESGHSGPFGLLYPGYGPVEALLGFGLFALLVDQLTPAAVAALAGPYPSLVTPVTTAAASLLWLVGAVMVFAVALDQVQANPRTFADRASRDAFLAEHRPTESALGRNLVLMILGGATAVLAWDTTMAVLSSMVPIVVEVGGPLPASLTLGNVAILVVFFVGFAAYARALDRLVIGGAREFLYRHHADDWD